MFLKKNITRNVFLFIITYGVLIVTKEEVFSVVKKVILEILPDLNADDISISKSLKDLGANSIDRMEVTTMAMEELGMVIPLLSFANVSNIEGLVTVLADNIN